SGGLVTAGRFQRRLGIGHLRGNRALGADFGSRPPKSLWLTGAGHRDRNTCERVVFLEICLARGAICRSILEFRKMPARKSLTDWGGCLRTPTPSILKRTTSTGT